MIATAHHSLEAAADVFRSAGINAVILGDSVTGEAREVAKVYAALVREIRSFQQPFKAPIALISGGECTVTMSQAVQGRGGRCTEFLLSLAVELDGMPGVYALAADTDGIDGSEDNAGAWWAPDLTNRPAGGSASARAFLDRHDAYGFFHAAGSLIRPAPRAPTSTTIGNPDS